MVLLPQYRARLADGSVLIERHGGNDAAPGGMRELLDKNVGGAGLGQRERVGIEAPAVVRQLAPALRRMNAEIEYVGLVNETVADAPMRRVGAQAVKPAERHGGERAHGK